MKPYFLLVLFYLISYSILNAQFKFSANGKAGFTAPSISEKGEDVDINNIVKNQTLRHGGFFGMGVEVGFAINDKNTVYSGLSYRNMQYKYDIIDLGVLNEKNVFGEISFIPSFGGIEIPIAYKRLLFPKFSFDIGCIIAYNKLISYSFQGNMPHFSNPEYNDTLDYNIYKEENWPSFFTFELLYGVSYQLNSKIDIAVLMQNGINKTDELNYNVELFYKNESIQYKPSFAPKIKSIYFKFSYLLFDNCKKKN